MKIPLDPDEWAPLRKPVAGSAPAPLTYTDRAIAARLGAILAARAADIGGAIQAGTPATQEAYREQVGELRGIRWAMVALADAQGQVDGGEAQKPATEKPLYVA